MEYINGVDSMNNHLPMSEKQVELLEKALAEKAAGTAQEDKKDDETAPF